jgi:hypothetical protein
MVKQPFQEFFVNRVQRIFLYGLKILDYCKNIKQMLNRDLNLILLCEKFP